MSNELKDLLRLAVLVAIFLVLMGVAITRISRLEKRIHELENAPADTSVTKKVDTVYFDNPQLIEHYESEKEKVAIEVRRLRKQLAEALNLPPDTTFIHDTTQELVFLPREYMVYKDSAYRAVVSGVQPRLDSIEVYQKTITQTITKTIKVPDRKRWGIGPQVGMGWNGKKVQPYVGVGVQYNVVRF